MPTEPDRTGNSRELLLMRHAKSSWGADVPSDFERPLAGRGERDARRLGRWMLEAEVVPDHVVCSPARRVRETVERVLAELGREPGEVRWEERIYEGTPGDLLAAIGGSPASAERVLLIGHNPGLEILVSRLADSPPTLSDSGKLFPTAALARFRLGVPWRQVMAGTCTLADLVRPKELD